MCREGKVTWQRKEERRTGERKKREERRIKGRKGEGEESRGGGNEKRE